MNVIPITELKNNKSFCILAFNHAHVTTQQKRALCCFADNFHEDTFGQSLSDYWNSDLIKDIRVKMLAGERVSYCNKCYRDDDSGIGSSRGHFNRKFNVEKIIEHCDDTGTMSIGPEFFDYRTKLCNLKCPSCSHEFSTAHATLTDKLYPSLKIKTTVDYSFEDQCANEIVYSLKHKTCRSLYWAGGEPMMSPMHWRVFEELSSLSKLESHTEYVKDLDIYYSTNLTKAEWKGTSIPKVMTAFNPLVYVSIDGVEETFEYTRDGAAWSEVKENFISYYKNINHNKKMSVTTVFTAPVIFDIDRYLDFILSYDIDFAPNRFETSPGRLLDIRSFPDEISRPAIGNAVKLLEKVKYKKGVERTIDILNSYIKEKEETPTTFNNQQALTESKNHILLRDPLMSARRSYGDLLQMLNKDAYEWYSSI